MNKIIAFSVSVSMMLCVHSSMAQSDGKKNTIYVNATNPLIFGAKAMIVGYERTIGKHQSVSLNIGGVSLPKFVGGSGNDSLQLRNNSKDKGFHIAADYRFYLASENKYEAPRGVYVGPYYSFNSFSRDNDWLLKTDGFNGEVTSETSLRIHTAGLQLGYQFILWKALAIDLILIGPGVGLYSLDTKLNTNLSDEEEALFFERLNSYLEDKIPGYDFVIKEGEFNKTGSMRTTSFGFRYMINIGFRF